MPEEQIEASVLSSRELRQQRKRDKLERRRERLVEEFGNNGDSQYVDFLSIVHRVLGAVQAQLCHDYTAGHERGVKVRGLQHIASAETVTKILDKLTQGKYQILQRQSGGIYTTQVTQGSDECRYLQLMVLATKKDQSGDTPALTPRNVSQKLGLDEDLAQLMLEELTDGEGPLFRFREGYTASEGYWEQKI